MAFTYTFPFFFDAALTLAQDAYGRQLRQLLPPGAIWNLEPTSNLYKTLLAAGSEYARVAIRGEDLINEGDPTTADQTLEQWEEMLGLPDEQVTSIPATVAKRRIAITQKYTSRGGQNSTFFEDLAFACGYTATFSNYNALLSRCGRMRCGQRLRGLASAYAFLVTVTSISADALPQADFERVIRHAAHSHVTVAFDYP